MCTELPPISATIKLSYHQAQLPSSHQPKVMCTDVYCCVLSYHQAQPPPSPATTKLSDHQAQLPPSLATIKLPPKGDVYLCVLVCTLSPIPTTIKLSYHKAELPSSYQPKVVCTDVYWCVLSYHQAQLPSSSATTKLSYHQATNQKCCVLICTGVYPTQLPLIQVSTSSMTIQP